NSPRYFAPATSAPISRATIFLFLRPSGTSCRTMRCASPSTTAVLPTPGSPISTGLFFVRRDSTWITRRISSSRPMTGSSFPFRVGCMGGLADARRKSGLRTAACARVAPERSPHRRRDRRGIDVHLPEDFGNDAPRLLNERQQDVLRRDLGVPLAIRELLRRED